MARLTTLFSVCVSLLLTLNVSAQDPLLQRPRAMFRPDSTETCQLSMEIRIGDRNLTALLISRYDKTATLHAVVMNEFGVAAFNFAVKPSGRVKISGAIPLLRRPWIRAVVRGDLKFLYNAPMDSLTVSGSRRVTVSRDGSTVTMENRRYGITYVIHPIAPAADGEKEEEERP